MHLELHRVPSSSVVELGLERSPFSSYPQGRPPLDLVCSLWPSPPTKAEKGGFQVESTRAADRHEFL